MRKTGLVYAPKDGCSGSRKAQLSYVDHTKTIYVSLLQNIVLRTPCLSTRAYIPETLLAPAAWWWGRRPTPRLKPVELQLQCQLRIYTHSTTFAWASACRPASSSAPFEPAACACGRYERRVNRRSTVPRRCQFRARTLLYWWRTFPDASSPSWSAFHSLATDATLCLPLSSLTTCIN